MPVNSASDSLLEVARDHTRSTTHITLRVHRLHFAEVGLPLHPSVLGSRMFLVLLTEMPFGSAKGIRPL